VHLVGADRPDSAMKGSSMTTAEAEHGHAPKIEGAPDLAKLALGALGVVYGDIGTSPLYALKECFANHVDHGVETRVIEPVANNVFGVLSLVFWSLTMVVVVKYLTFIMRADNRGEGGILALLALLKPKAGEKPMRSLSVMVLLGLFGAALLYGDGVITPAISVLSAVEGLEIATTALRPVIVPVTVAILVALFLAQRRGTAGMGRVFGPTMLIWFVTIAAVGAPWIFREPRVLQAVNPLYGVQFLFHHGLHGFLILGSVVLCITGGEALYADMGHFGRLPIRAAWYVVVFPALILNYFGQGAALLATEGRTVDNPFFGLVHGWTLYPLVAISTVATVVASQALISGAYSLTQQAVQLGYCPRVSIVHTSGEAEGQIYIPEVNNALMVACVALVLGFEESSRLAAAYGIAVTGTMSITTVLFYSVARQRWGWTILRAGALSLLFLVIDLAFFGANATKIGDGGWFPLAVGLGVFTMMTTWKRGREALAAFIKEATMPIDLFLADIDQTKPVRVKGAAVFMTSNPDGAPPVLLHHFKHNKVLHEKVVLLSIATQHVPEVTRDKRIRHIKDLGHGLYQVTADFGFMQTPNVLEVMGLCAQAGLEIAYDDTSFFLGKETLIVTERKGLARWRKILFSYLSRNARPANAFFRIPPNRVVELGTQIEL